MNTKRKDRRSAFTLIETVLAVTLEILVAGMAVALLFLVSDVRIRENHSDRARRDLTRLAEDFRRDVHDAVEVDLTEQAVTLSQKDDRTCVYGIESVEDSDELKCYVNRLQGARLIGREEYVLPEASLAWFKRGEGDAAGLLALSVWTQPLDRHGKTLLAAPTPEQLNPFTGNFGGDVDPRELGNWRVVLARIPKSDNPEDEP